MQSVIWLLYTVVYSGSKNSSTHSVPLLIGDQTSVNGNGSTGFGGQIPISGVGLFSAVYEKRENYIMMV